MEVGEEGGRLYTYCCIKMGSDDSHFNVSLIVRDKVIRQCPQTTTLGPTVNAAGIKPEHGPLVNHIRGQ